ncbi:AI-2E family transporter [Enterococcus sp. JM4C]|uniref:AI-2E family transporter n=1 Tax=Candidatus Enterococcus huntleyi TaxID=1857217 RepID=UPI0013796340|nr:AI-2E family transporter [Enterococcus sp. JM4C]KAF1296438.1 AI-2E family transporter [Enterococcus sp. JM4C]
MEKQEIERLIKKYIIIGALVVVGIIYLRPILGIGHTILGAFTNIILAALLAYVINIVMVKVEHGFDRLPYPWVKKIKRPISLLLSLIILFVAITIFIGLVMPSIFDSLNTLFASLPDVFNQTQKFLIDVFHDNPEIRQTIEALEIDWKSLLQNTLSFLGGGVANFVDVAITIVSAVLGSLFNFLLILVFAVYILLDKERFVRAYDRVGTLYISAYRKRRLDKVLQLIHHTFSSFIGGQCLEAVILGTLCATGMLILNMPYAVMVGTLVGVINIVPIVGAYVGGAIGMFMVFTVDPILSLGFLVYLIVLQQFESNIIYPRVVGNSVGLPGIFVLASVMVFGTLAGIPGMFLGIPATACIYKLGKIFIVEKEQKKAQMTDQSL